MGRDVEDEPRTVATNMLKPGGQVLKRDISDIAFACVCVGFKLMAHLRQRVDVRLHCRPARRRVGVPFPVRSGRSEKAPISVGCIGTECDGMLRIH